MKLQAMDKPDHRKIHDHVMPKCGGMAMAVGACVPIMLWAPKSHFITGLLIGGLIIVFFGVADDIKDLSPNVKLLGQVMAALVIILVGGIKINDLGRLLSIGTYSAGLGGDTAHHICRRRRHQCNQSFRWP